MSRFGHRRSDSCAAVREDQITVRDDHLMNRQVGEGVEGRQEPLRIGLVDEDVQPASGSIQDIAGDKRGVVADEEHNLLRLAVKFDRFNPAW